MPSKRLWLAGALALTLAAPALADRGSGAWAYHRPFISRFGFRSPYYLYPEAIFFRYPPYSYGLYPPFARVPLPVVPWYNPVRIVPWFYPFAAPTGGFSPVNITLGGDTNTYNYNAPLYPPAPPAPTDAPDREPFYLERALRAETVNLAELARKQVVFEKMGEREYRARWTGPAEEIVSLEVRTVDARGGIELGSQPITAPPFERRFTVDAHADAVEVITRWRSGRETRLRIPVADLREE
jgi:hypothetical protein